ncbi:hypothetical protein E6P09_06580 [Haloferax mediterranei ATCC 33500]|uniref:Uncharacterized protein n=1 Tax=Haloferax mediterranei (strain ATCC 33500 / DSM 1411 / JCM 8866 / NBRC 14739 / NCIMB 2177 / R-4) TaxID=523841 RepID=I3R2H0_HALMT|nr:hypothetical protein [Haloferax mediterranei]AFK18430.1 hypothetical protein HFX_0707 [Haloferax mediterranei ATCC 33500]AHZ22180.1 hypothetical protein BM92_05695 [Haloferax mediterranei ATCC 33500]EMA02293.1 hypothetical protein C439_06920 [Haloferax mediterranei ATCC 33500]MDX5988523.1 hypothetical protein [Haloferax mediterranei ATCC 33500]QCQ74939.1 hypothetical protein E6P09_06580 [Haloferax mediterranei ATCC 33500]
MLDAPLDTLYTWTALSVAATVLLGTVAGLPTTPAPDASSVADTVDGVAVSEFDTTAEHPLTADAVRLGSKRIGLRNEGGAAHATFAFGPITPATPDSRLGSVAMGANPNAVFDSPASFAAAAAAARQRNATWRSAAESLVVRHVSWEGTDVTVVAA